MARYGTSLQVILIPGRHRKLRPDVHRTYVFRFDVDTTTHSYAIVAAANGALIDQATFPRLTPDDTAP